MKSSLNFYTVIYLNNTSVDTSPEADRNRDHSANTLSNCSNTTKFKKYPANIE
jgi:hypothetical protein